jgi:uncharacterized protein YbjT (DUF2867 family)
MAWTILRASYFLQNRSTTHAPEARGRCLPAGKGRTAFVDARDVAASPPAPTPSAATRARPASLSGPAALTDDVRRPVAAP